VLCVDEKSEIQALERTRRSKDADQILAKLNRQTTRR
jgi:hypothetical protein